LLAKPAFRYLKTAANRAARALFSGATDCDDTIGRNAICKKCPSSAAKLIHLASKVRTGRTKVSRRDTPKLNRAVKCPGS